MSKLALIPNRHMDLQSEFMNILSAEPGITHLQLIENARERGWNLEPLTAGEQAVAAQMPAWKALLMANARSESAARRLASTEQILTTGSVFILNDALTSCQVESLRDLFASHIDIHGNAPLALAAFLDHTHLGLQELLVTTSRRVLFGLARDRQGGSQADTSETYAVLMNRCLLRRTYASSSHGLAVKNRNNQAWHQDSSAQFLSRPMLTFWIPLQDQAGTLIPGIETANVTVDRFLPSFGDGVECLQDIFDGRGQFVVETMVPSVEAGGCVVFNGLTFHRTYVASHMAGFRDALLIRISPASHSSHFPGDRSSDLFFDL